jgi:RNA-directed DNA polymerase
MLLERASQSMQLPIPVLLGIARRADHAYKSYSIPKRTGGTRIIHHPSRKLKAVQRWLLGHEIAKWHVHDSAFAYRTGRSIRMHAEYHSAGAFLLRLDFKNFFPSLLRRHLATFLAGGPPGVTEWTKEDREFFLAIVCRGDALTIGAATSPTLSNVLCEDLDNRLTTIALSRDVRYSRYADDLFFSTTLPNVLATLVADVRGIIESLPLPDGLILNDIKTHHTSRKWKRQVTGIVLTPDGAVSLGRERKRFIRSLLHRYDALTEAQRGHLRGLLAFAQDIEPDLINRLALKYGADRINVARR